MFLWYVWKNIFKKIKKYKRKTCEKKIFLDHGEVVLK